MTLSDILKNIFIEKIKTFYNNLLIIWKISEKSNTEVSLFFFSYLLV